MERVEPHPELPLDPDAERVGVTRPLQFRWQNLLVVWSGGFVGTAARYGVTRGWVSPATGFPVSDFVINLVGAFLLGALLEALMRRGPDSGRRRMLRLLAGTGFCGGFTTYSTLAMGTVLLARADRVGLALAYAAVSVIGGLVAVACGIFVAGANHRRRVPTRVGVGRARGER